MILFSIQTVLEFQDEVGEWSVTFIALFLFSGLIIEETKFTDSFYYTPLGLTAEDVGLAATDKALDDGGIVHLKV